jgi:hypothetical protein
MANFKRGEILFHKERGGRGYRYEFQIKMGDLCTDDLQVINDPNDGCPGIKKPNHRKRLKAAAEELDVGDGLPVAVPVSLQQLLHILRLEEYFNTLQMQVSPTVT